MQYSEFVRHVQQQAKLAGREQAENAVQAVIETLAERLSHGEPANLAAQLPEPIKGYLLAPGVSDQAQKYTVDEFIARVAEHTGVDANKAEMVIRAVFEALDLAVSPGEMHDVRVRFPPEYTRLFGERDQRQVSA